MGLKIWAITAEINKHKSIINKNKKKHDKIVLLARTKLNSIVVLISNALIDSYVSQDHFVLVKNLLRECEYMNEEIKTQ